MKTLLAVIAAVLITGCASSGGGQGAPETSLPPPRVIQFDACREYGGFGLLACWSSNMQRLQARCPGLETGCVDRELAEMNAEYWASRAGRPDTLVTYPPQAFASWSQSPRPATFAIPAVSMDVNYQGTEAGVTFVSGGFSVRQNGTATLGYGPDGRPFYLGIAHSGGPTSFFDAYFGYGSGIGSSHLGYSFLNLASVGQPGLDIAISRPDFGGSQSPFVTATIADFAMAANPYELGWNYQSFGIWNQHWASTPWISAASFGSATPVSAVPTIGSATFTGKLGGVYISPAGQGSVAFADLTVNADFSARTLGFASNSTATTRDLVTSSPAPNLNLSGTLTYSAGSGTFSGTLTNARGTLSGSSTGRFYGPAAQELGGVFALRSPFGVETFTGGYGAKR